MCKLTIGGRGIFEIVDGSTSFTMNVNTYHCDWVGTFLEYNVNVL